MFFKQRKPKKFRYIPKNLKDTNLKDDPKIKSSWENLRHSNKSGQKQNKTLYFLLLALGMIIVLWYVLNNYEI